MLLLCLWKYRPYTVYYKNVHNNVALNTVFMGRNTPETNTQHFIFILKSGMQ